MKLSQIKLILEMAANGQEPEEIAEELYQAGGDEYYAERDDDRDDNGPSCDDRFDSRGEAYLPTFNEAGEPYWI